MISVGLGNVRGTAGKPMTSPRVKKHSAGTLICQPGPARVGNSSPFPLSFMLLPSAVSSLIRSYLESPQHTLWLGANLTREE